MGFFSFFKASDDQPEPGSRAYEEAQRARENDPFAVPQSGAPQGTPQEAATPVTHRPPSDEEFSLFADQAAVRTNTSAVETPATPTSTPQASQVASGDGQGAVHANTDVDDVFAGSVGVADTIPQTPQAQETSTPPAAERPQTPSAPAAQSVAKRATQPTPLIRQDAQLVYPVGYLQFYELYTDGKTEPALKTIEGYRKELRTKLDGGPVTVDSYLEFQMSKGQLQVHFWRTDLDGNPLTRVDDNLDAALVKDLQGACAEVQQKRLKAKAARSQAAQPGPGAQNAAALAQALSQIDPNTLAQLLQGLAQPQPPQT